MGRRKLTSKFLQQFPFPDALFDPIRGPNACKGMRTTTKSQRSKVEKKLAYTIDELAKNGPEGRTSLFKAIKENRLVARKSGRRTIILPEDYDRYLHELPIIDRSPTT